MFDVGLFIDSDIKRIIHSSFPSAQIDIYHDNSQDSYFVSIQEQGIYYSDEYQLLVMNIKIDILWKHNINNCYFICEKKSCCDEIVDKISAFDKAATEYIAWTISDLAKIRKIKSGFSLNYDLVA